MPARSEPAELPEPFRRAVASLRAAALRPEVSITETAAPGRLAPYAVALAGEVTVDGAEAASGRLVVLHDPDGQDGWDGTTRIVAYVRAGTDLEIAADPMLPAVGWSWLVEALTERGAGHTAPAGTVTRAASERFGELSRTAAGAEVELRAAWTPLGGDLGPHVAAWSDVLCSAAGLPPVTPGVTPIPARRPTRR